MADAGDSKSPGGNPVRVRLSPRAPDNTRCGARAARCPSLSSKRCSTRRPISRHNSSRGKHLHNRAADARVVQFQSATASPTPNPWPEVPRMPNRCPAVRPALGIAVALVVTTCNTDTQPAAPRSAVSPDVTVSLIGGEVLVGAGNVATCRNSNDAATATLLDGIPGTVFADGDLAYDNGAKDRFNKCYNPTWGRHKARTRPTPGEIEYKQGGAQPYFNYFGAAAGTPGQGYYSYDLGDWHVVVLNSGISTATGSAQEQWLRGDLAASPARCTVAYWHHPRFFSGSSAQSNPAVKPLWDDLYAAGAEIVINAHYENYERFALQTSSGTADPQLGIRQFTVGTGGIGVNSFGGGTAANSEVHNSGTPGVLKLTLAANSYSWQFIPIAGFSFTDSGSGACH